MQHIQEIISKAIHELYHLDFNPEISPAPKPELGEYCVNIFPIVKQVGKAPNIISEEVAKELRKNAEIFKGTSATGGYVNFFLTDAVWLNIFSVIASGTKGSAAIQDSEKQGTGFLHTQEGQRTIVVDYIGANVGKPLHIGHICTPSIGQVICNVYRHLGYNVIGDSHFGDWGGIFGKLIYAWRRLPFGFESNYLLKKYPIIIEIRKSSLDAQEIWKNEQLNKMGVDFLLDLYQTSFLGSAEINQDIDEEFLKKETGEKKEFQFLSGVGIDLSNPEERKYHEENVELWKKFTSISIAETEKKLNLLNVHATYNIGESFYEGLGLPRPNGEDYPDLKWNMKDIVKELVNKGIATQNEDGSVGVVFPEEMKLPSCILQKKDGTGLYLTSDLAAIKYRLTNGWNPEKIVYSVDVRQQLHLRQAFTIAKMAWGDELGANNVEFTHAHNGFIKLKEGAMSTRHGTVIFLQALIDEGNERTRKILEEKGRVGDKALKPEDIEAITVGAIKYSYLAQDREKDVTFDWDKALNFEGNSGPYIQYAYVRARKINSNSIKYEKYDKVNLSSYDKLLIQSIFRFQDAISTTAKTYKPHHIALYAYDLAVAFNSFYVHTPKILEEKDEAIKNLRLSLVNETSNTLKTAFLLLGINMPDEM